MALYRQGLKAIFIIIFTNQPDKSLWYHCPVTPGNANGRRPTCPFNAHSTRY